MNFPLDLSLLENAARYSIEKEAKPIKFEQKKSFQKPQAFQALQRACWRRNRCRLLGLPHHFSRHRENTSTHQTSNDNIYWRITWMLPHHTKHVIYSERFLFEKVFCHVYVLLHNFCKFPFIGFQNDCDWGIWWRICWQK